MPHARKLVFQDSKLVAFQGSPDCVRIELDGYVHRWQGSGASRRGTRSVQRVHIEIDFPDVDQGIRDLPATLSSGHVISEALVADGRGSVGLPVSVEGIIRLELVTTSGEKLQVVGERFRAEWSGEEQFIDEIPAERDPARNMN